MSATTTMVHVRVNEQVKAQASETRAAMAEADEIIASRRARFTSADDLFRSLEEGSGK